MKGYDEFGQMRSRVIFFLIFTSLLMVFLFSPLAPILLKDLAISKLEKALDMKIAVGRVEFRFPAKLAISHIEARDKYGPAFIAENGNFQLETAQILKARLVLNCNFRNIRLRSSISNFLNDALKQFAVPSRESYLFDDMKGRLTLGKGILSIDDLKAKGADFKFSADLLYLNKKDMDYAAEFEINKSVVISDGNQKNPFLIDEDKDGWYTIKLSMKGDPRRPSNIFFSTGGIELQVKPHGQ